MNNSKKRIITDCAICAALTVILTVAAIYVPPIWFITYFVCGTPVAYIVFKHGLSAGVITALCAVLSVMAVVNIGVGVIAAAAVYILPALVFSGCYKKFGANGFYSTLCSAAIVYLIIFSTGVGLILAALTVKFRDIMHLYTVFLTALMYLTPVIYPMSMLPGWVYKIVSINPITMIMTIFRNVVIYNTIPTLLQFMIPLAIVIFTLFLGLWVFYKEQDTFILNL